MGVYTTLPEVKKKSKLFQGNYLILPLCLFILLQQFNSVPAYACPEAGSAPWFVGHLSLETGSLPETIEVYPNYAPNLIEKEFFYFTIFNKTKNPIYIFGYDDLVPLTKAQNDNTLPEQINILLANEKGYQVNRNQNKPVFQLRGEMLKSFDPRIEEYNQFSYSLPEDIEVPLPQYSSFIIISNEEIYSLHYQLSYELTDSDSFYKTVNACDRAMYGDDSVTPTPTTNLTNSTFPSDIVPAGVLLIVLISGVILAVIFKQKFS